MDLVIRDPAQLDRALIQAIADGGVAVTIDPGLQERLDRRRDEMLTRLSSGSPVYGVNTGLGAFSNRSLDADAQSRHQEQMMLARSAGGPPWLTPAEVRTVLAVRLRTFLNGDAGVSAQLCNRLAEHIQYGILPAIPRRSTGVAGEIVPMAHLGNALIGGGEVLDDTPAEQALAQAALKPIRLGPKEGIAILQGVPTATALALLAARDARRVYRQMLFTAAAEFALTMSTRDVLDPALARADDVLGRTMAEMRRLAGTVSQARSLQPPVSFRATPQVLAHLVRCITRLEEAVDRALAGITDSPAFLGDDFVGSAGFYGYDLATHLHALTVALVGAAELGATRLHRLMDPKVSGLTAQLAAEPGRDTGVSPIHKRAIGVAHELRRATLPATIGPVEASGGQEDTQTFALEAAAAGRDALDGAIEVTACEQLALHQARCLGATVPADSADELGAFLDTIAAVLPSTADDRAFGQDVEILRKLIASGNA
jgi:histidine ammonia-lyase